MKLTFATRSTVLSAVGAVALAAVMPAQAENIPASFNASPQVYKVLAENDELRIVLATWKPGQKDKNHSHPMAAVYTVTDCHARVTTADGKVKEINKKAGAAQINPAVKSHTFENIGKAVCQQVLVEKKK